MKASRFVSKISVAFVSIASVLLAPMRAANADIVHTVRHGETIASLSTRYYGEASREIIVVAANALNVQASAGILPGTRVVIPSVSYYRVRERDTWERIAYREFVERREARRAREDHAARDVRERSDHAADERDVRRGRRADEVTRPSRAAEPARMQSLSP